MRVSEVTRSETVKIAATERLFERLSFLKKQRNMIVAGFLNEAVIQQF